MQYKMWTFICYKAYEMDLKAIFNIIINIDL